MLSKIFLVNALIEGGFGLYNVGVYYYSTFASGPQFPIVTLPQANQHDPDLLALNEIAMMAMVAFGAIPALMVAFYKQKRPVGVPVALGCLAYHLWTVATSYHRHLNGLPPLAVHVSWINATLEHPLVAKYLQGVTVPEPWLNLAAVHGFLSLWFIVWLLFGGYSSAPKVSHKKKNV